MPEIEASKDLNVEEAHSQLSEGLKTCRSILKDYRAKIADAPESRSPEDPFLGHSD